MPDANDPIWVAVQKFKNDRNASNLLAQADREKVYYDALYTLLTTLKEVTLTGVKVK